MKIYDAVAKSPVGEAFRVDRNSNVWFYQEIAGEMVVVSKVPGTEKGTTVEFDIRDIDEALHFEDWLPAESKCPRPVGSVS